MKIALGIGALALAILALIFRPPQLGGPAPLVVATERPVRAARAPVRRTASARLIVYVAGEVRRPGVYDFGPSARAVDALGRAGGATADADLVAVNLAAPLHDGDEVAIPKLGANPPHSRRTSAPRARASHAPRARGGRRAAPQLAPEGIDLNSASADELATLPGIGPVLAQRIVDFREVNGPFASVDELADVDGIGPRQLDAVQPFLMVR